MTIAQQIEIDELKKQIKEIQEDKLIAPFVSSMLEKIGILLTDEKFEEWPIICRIAYDVASREYPINSQLYYSRLPK